MEGTLYLGLSPKRIKKMRRHTFFAENIFPFQNSFANLVKRRRHEHI